MKTILIFILLGAMIGAVVTSFLVPSALPWYTFQGAQTQEIVQVPEIIRYATAKLLKWQAIGAGIGGTVGLVIGVFAVRGRKHNAPKN